MKKEQEKKETGEWSFLFIFGLAVFLFAFVKFNGVNHKDKLSIQDTTIQTDSMDSHIVRDLINVGKSIIKSNL